jgi:AAHS family 4-hydroxybenzoate transporter-like MFS transporter
VIVFGFFNASCAFAQSPTQLMILRLLTGIGLGTAMPTAATLLSEYVPKRLRAFLVTVMFAGFALGSGLAGVIASALLGKYGWRGVLLTGGVLPLLSLPLLLWLLPESARLLAVQGRPSEEIAKLLKRVCNANFSANTSFISQEHRLTAAKIPVQLLFGDGYAFGTMLLWASCFMGLLILYLVTGWLPTLISDAGYSVQEAASISAMFQVGSIPGALIVGFLMDRIESSRVVAAAYFFGAIAIFSLGASILNSGWLLAQVAIAGFFIGGAQTGLNALAPAFYPTQARATGVSWMNGIGRGGAIVGSLVGGLLLSLGWQFGAVFAALAMPAMFAAGAVVLSRYASRSIVREAIP